MRPAHLRRTRNIYVSKVKDFFHSEFTIKDLGEADFFLSIQLTKTATSLAICQQKYIQDILQETNMQYVRPCETPFPTACKVSKANESLLLNPSKYRRLIGRLLYLPVTQPDLTFAIQQLSQLMAAPTNVHRKIRLQVLKYLQGTKCLQLHFTYSSNPKLAAFSDSNWRCCRDTCQSITGYYIFFGEFLVSWKSKKQVTVARSSAEAEYRAVATTVSEVLWLTYILKDFHLQFPDSVDLLSHASIC